MSRIFWFSVVLLLFLVPLPGLTFLYKISIAQESICKLKGNVVDAVTKASIEFAYVSLYHENDSVPIQITATNIKGEYLFSRLKPGNYFINVHLMGYLDFKTAPFSIKEFLLVISREPIELKVELLALGEITIRANSRSPVYQLDKRTIYAENQLSASGGSASDLLHKLPSVTLSPDGKISIHGNDDLLVFINGKPSSLRGDELLQSTPAAEVRKIELITSPSAKYDASGSGGIINLITKKSTRDGVNGNVQMASDLLGGYSSDFLLNYKYNKFSFYTGIDRNRRRNEGDIDYTTNFLKSLNVISKTGIQKAERTNTGFRSGFDYLQSSTNKISISGNAGYFETRNNGDWETVESVKSLYIKPLRNLATDDNNRNGRYGGADLTYEHKFNKPNRILSISALWNTVNYSDHYLNRINDLAGLEQMSQLTFLDKKNHNFQYNADYTIPTGKAGILEIGYQVTLNKENESYHSELKFLPAPTVNSNQQNQFSGVTQAGYSTWQFKIGYFNFKAGLRAENLIRELNTLDNKYPLQRFDLYPTFNSSYKIDSTKEIFFNYSRRTDQLRAIQLDPLPRWYDFYNVTIGNPNLQNEITDKIGVNYLFIKPKLTLNTELYFYNTSDKIDVIRSIYRDDIVQNRYENTGREQTLGIEFNANWKVIPWFKLNEKLDFIDSYLDVQLNQISEKKSYRQWYSATTADFAISSTTMLELDFSYYSPALTAQSKINRVYLAGLSFRQTFLNNKLTFTLTGRDVLGLYRKCETIQGTDFDQVLTTHYKFPVRFSLSYKFNHYKRDERRIAKAPVLE